MPVAVQSAFRTLTILTVGLVPCSLLMTGCVSPGGRTSPQNLEKSMSRAEFNSGRVFVYLVDENGEAIPGARVDFTWDKPQFHKTSTLTDRTGRASFRDVPEMAEVNIEYPGGNYFTRLAVAQSGLSELRLNLETYGENRKHLNRLEATSSSAFAGATTGPN